MNGWQLEPSTLSKLERLYLMTSPAWNGRSAWLLCPGGIGDGEQKCALLDKFYPSPKVEVSEAK